MSSHSTDPAPCEIAPGLEAVARDRPSDLAVTDREHRWTYAELEERVAHLAGSILHLAEDDTQWVPVVAARSAHSVAAIHAGVRAGRPLALIDASIPPAGRCEILERLGSPSVIIDTTETADERGPRIVIRPAIDQSVDRVGPQPVDGDRAGLVLFTSGSTGRPKGVVHSWRTLDASVERRRQRALAWGTRYAVASAPFGFVSGLGHAVQPAAGVAIGIVDPTALTLDELLDHVDARGFDTMPLMPSQAVALARRTRARPRLMSLRVVSSYGEPVRWEHVQTMRALAHPEALIDVTYGCSETFGGVLTRMIGPEEPVGVGRVPFGPIIDPTRVRLLPVVDQPDATEIAVAYPIALGYLDDPDLDRSRFDVVDGRRYWRSGDLARVDTDGDVHLYGRLDDLVKINGKLAEPSESEEALRAMAEIHDAVVLPHRRSDGSPRLVAHVVPVAGPDGADAIDPIVVRERLEARLARHVVPAVLVRHDRLPVGDRGKVDRRALQRGELTPWRATPLRSPTEDRERFLTTAIARIVDLPEVGLDDDIWYLGLDSLGAAELSAAVADAGMGELTLERLLVDRTPAAIAARLRTAIPARRSPLVMLNPQGSAPPIVALPGAGCTAVTMHGLATALGSDQPIAVVEAQGMHVPGAPDRTVEAAAEHAHRLLIDNGIVPSAHRLVVVGHSAGGVIGYELCRRLELAGNQVHLVSIDAAPRMPITAAAPAVDRPPIAMVTAAWRRLAELWRVAIRKVRGRSPIEVGRRVVGRAIVVRYSLRPGPPSTSVRRYYGFATIATRAIRRYQAAPARFPATLFAVEGSSASARAAALIDDLEIRPIGGAHASAVELPHVAVVAHLIGELNAVPTTDRSSDVGSVRIPIG